MSATTLAVLHAGATPVFRDVRPDTWLIEAFGTYEERAVMPVSLYGLHVPGHHECIIDDAAQTLRPHGGSAFTSYSFQASKILALGEGGMLVTDDEALATSARQFSSLGYRMRADQPRIDPAVLKAPDYDRHHSVGFNYRMNDLTAAEGLRKLPSADRLIQERRHAAALYRDAIAGCDWLMSQHVPDGWTHDSWCYAVACDTPERARWLADAMVRHGGERPFAAWKLTYQEPAFRHLAPDGTCPIAESLQPRLLQFQTNNLASAERNARALRRALTDTSPPRVPLGLPCG